MGQGCTTAKGPHDETIRLVGEAVQVHEPGISTGEFGYQEVVEPGKPMTYTSPHGIMVCRGYCCALLQYPISAPVFGLILFIQYFATCCLCCCGNAWFRNPSQTPYIHALTVVWQTLKNTCCGVVCCGGWFIKVQPGILFATMSLPTPPRFIFDEEKDTAYLVPLADYIKAKASAFPPVSGKYRSVDGGGNSSKYTFLGQGCRGYAMNEPYMILSPTVLPDPEKISRSLQLRSTFRESPFGQNGLCCWFANLAIHEFFRSATGADKKYTGGVEKPWVNLHSGYLDLQTLYGFNQERADSVRTFSGGKLKTVAETRFDHTKLVETFVILKVLMREHNWVCDQLKAKYPTKFTTDEELYQQARLIMGGVFINVILRQYGDQMFGESPADGGIFAEMRQSYGCWPASLAGFENQTAGNHSTFNFNMIYRWHTAIPAEWDAKAPWPSETDEDMRKIFLAEYTSKAGGFGPNNTPEGLFQKTFCVPAADLRHSRACGCPRLNDVRRTFNAAYRSFEEMTGDVEVARQLAEFYPTVEDVELPVGIQVERAMQGGWGMGSTLGTAILCDAFNSIRQDRFYTTDFTPEVYTPWGLEHAKTTVLVDLLNRHLNMGLDRNIQLARVPGWKPPSWSSMKGFPFSLYSYTARGFPDLK